jgi:hypothetical protein
MATALTNNRLTAQEIEKAKADFERQRGRIEKHARIYHSHRVADADANEEMTAETTALAWKYWLRAVESGKDPNGFVSRIADFCARQVNMGRRLAGQESARSIHNPVTQRKRGIVITNDTPPERDDGGSIIENLRDNTTTPTADAAAFRIDFPNWLERIGKRKAGIAEDMAKGDGTADIAMKHKLSSGRISQLRLELKQDYDDFHAEKPKPDRRR